MNTAATIASEAASRVGENIRRRRLDLKLSQAAVAQRVAVPMAQSHLSKYETGAVLPTLPVLLALASALECRIEDLTEGL